MLFEDTYQTIAGRSQGTFRDKASKFIGIALPVAGEEDMKNQLAQLRKEYHDANHHCYAFRLGADKSEYRFNDDGEPSGSAGKPIYGQILSFDLTNILIVVVRYFGGTKLGIPGLINAYRTTAREALSQATVVTQTVNELYELRFEYPLMNDVMRVLKEENAGIILQDFETNCRIRFVVRKSSGTIIYSKFQRMNGVSVTFLSVYK